MNRIPLRRDGRAAPRREWCRTLALALSLAFPACFNPHPPPRPEPAPEAPFGALPPLEDELSWEKLVALEEWLKSEGAKRNPSLVVETQIQLNEGRVAYSRKDLEQGTAPPKTVQLRLEAARDGFNEVLANTTAGTASKARAKIGLQSAIALLDSPSTSRPGLVIVHREQWKALPARKDRLTPLKGAWSRITVHHSDESRSSQTGGTLEDSGEVVRLIQKFHMEDAEHHWGDIGYHYLIDSAGRIFEGRELTWQGAHAGGAGGRNNSQNVGVCMLGDFLKRSPTPAALKSLELLIDSLCEENRIPKSRVFLHHDFTTTECPGPALTSWVKTHCR